jgi:hypothetical protein
MFDVNSAVRQMITDALAPFHTRMYSLEQRDLILPEDAAVRNQVDRIISEAGIPATVSKAINEALEEAQETLSIDEETLHDQVQAQVTEAIEKHLDKQLPGLVASAVGDFLSNQSFTLRIN